MQRTRNTATSEARPARRLFRLRPAYLVLAVVLGLFAYKFLEKTQEIRHLAAQEAALQADNNAVARQNADLRARIRYERTPQFVEDSARSLLGYTKPGEIPVELKPSRPPPIVEVRQAPRTAPAPPAPAWKQWWQAFFG